MSSSFFLLILRAEQFVGLRVRRVLHRLDFLFDLVGRVEAGASQFAVDAFGVSVPVVSRHADHVAGLQWDVLAAAWLVGVDGDLVVGVLTSEVVDVIQGVEERRGVRMKDLHHLVGHTADLKPEKKQKPGIVFSFLGSKNEHEAKRTSRLRNKKRLHSVRHTHLLSVLLKEG